MAADKPAKVTEMEMILRWGWFFLLYFVLILLIGSFGLVAEF